MFRYIILLIFINISNTYLCRGQNPIKYADFDIFNFKGISPLDNQLVYPYVEVMEAQDSLFLKCYFSKSYCVEKKYFRQGEYYEEKVTFKESPDLEVICHRFFTKDYLLEFQEVFFYHNPKRFIGKIVKYTPQGDSSIIFNKTLWYDPVWNFDFSKISSDEVALRVVQSINASETVFTIQSKAEGILTHPVKGKIPYVNNTVEKYFLKNFYKKDNFSYFWHIYLKRYNR